MKNFSGGIFTGVVLTLVLIFGSSYLFVVSGGIPASTKSDSLPFEKFIARKALKAAMKGERDKTSPLPADEKNLLEGVNIYRNNCAVCHGRPGAAATAISMGLFPPSPWFFEPDQGVEDDPIGTIFWKVKNGIRLTGMPGFVDNLKEEEMWQVSLFLKAGKQIPESVKAALSAP